MLLFFISLAVAAMMGISFPAPRGQKPGCGDSTGYDRRQP